MRCGAVNLLKKEEALSADQDLFIQVPANWNKNRATTGRQIQIAPPVPAQSDTLNVDCSSKGGRSIENEPQETLVLN